MIKLNIVESGVKHPNPNTLMKYWDCHCRDHMVMVVGFTTTHAISAYNH